MDESPRSDSDPDSFPGLLSAAFVASSILWLLQLHALTTSDKKFADAIVEYKLKGKCFFFPLSLFLFFFPSSALDNYVITNFLLS